MGMYDEVNFTCPDCGNAVIEQSKAGECILAGHSQSSVPLIIADDILGNTVHCTGCNTRLTIVSNTEDIPKTVPLKLV